MNKLHSKKLKHYIILIFLVERVKFSKKKSRPFFLLEDTKIWTTTGKPVGVLRLHFGLFFRSLFTGKARGIRGTEIKFISLKKIAYARKLKLKLKLVLRKL